MDWIRKHKKEILFGGIVCLQLAAVFVYNLFYLKCQTDYDSSSGMVQMAEICRQNKLLIDDWGYQTTAGWDIPLMLGILFYKITGNIFVSMGIANNIFVVVYLFVIWDILRQYKIRFGNILLVLAVFLTPYTLGQLGYVPMMFTGTASYSLKTLIPLLLIDLIVRFEMGKRQKMNIALLFLMAALSFVTAVSSGPYLLICGIFPFLVYIFLKALVNNDVRIALRKESLAAYCGVAASLLGMVAGRFLNISGKTTSLTFVPIEKFANNALNCLAAIWALFGGIPQGPKVVILSVKGIICLCGLFVATGIVALIVYYAVRILQKHEKRALVLTVLCIQMINLAVFLLADLAYTDDLFEARYHIIPLVAAMLLAALFFEENSRFWNVLCRRTVMLVLLLSVMACSVARFTQYFMNTKTARINQMSKITDIAKEQGIDLIYFLCYGEESLQDGRIMRACDFDISVATLATYNAGITWGGSTRFFENGRHEGPVMAVISRDKVRKLPHHIRARMNLVDTLYGYRIYTVPENIFDCSTALPKTGEKGIDFAYSTGYQISGKMNEMGNLEANSKGGLVLFGPWYDADSGTFDVTLNYENGQKGLAPGTVIGKFGVYGPDGKIIRTSDIVAGENELVLKHVKPGDLCDTFHYTADAVPDSRLVIKSIVTERVSG